MLQVILTRFGGIAAATTALALMTYAFWYASYLLLNLPQSLHPYRRQMRFVCLSALCLGLLYQLYRKPALLQHPLMPLAFATTTLVTFLVVIGQTTRKQPERLWELMEACILLWSERFETTPMTLLYDPRGIIPAEDFWVLKHHLNLFRDVYLQGSSGYDKYDPTLFARIVSPNCKKDDYATEPASHYDCLLIVSLPLDNQELQTLLRQQQDGLMIVSAAPLEGYKVNSSDVHFIEGTGH